MRAIHSYLILLGMGLGSDAFACWACDAGPGEECYLADAAPETTEELARMDRGSPACSPGESPEVLSASNGVVYVRECVNGRLRTRQHSFGYRMRVRKIGTIVGDEASGSEADAGPGLARIPDIDATSGSSIYQNVGAREAVAVCDRGPNLPACREAHEAMTKKAQRMLSSAAPIEEE